MTDQSEFDSYRVIVVNYADYLVSHILEGRLKPSEFQTQIVGFLDRSEIDEAYRKDLLEVALTRYITRH